MYEQTSPVMAAQGEGGWGNRQPRSTHDVAMKAEMMRLMSNPATQDKTRVQCELDGLAGSISKLDELVQTVGMRLSAVMHNNPRADGSSGPSAPSESTCPLASAIRDQHARVATICYILDDILGRLEV